jgi:hypothetical protein
MLQAESPLIFSPSSPSYIRLAGMHTFYKGSLLLLCMCVRMFLLMFMLEKHGIPQHRKTQVFWPTTAVNVDNKENIVNGTVVVLEKNTAIHNTENTQGFWTAPAENVDNKEIIVNGTVVVWEVRMR